MIWEKFWTKNFGPMDTPGVTGAPIFLGHGARSMPMSNPSYMGSMWTPCASGTPGTSRKSENGWVTVWKLYSAIFHHLEKKFLWISILQFLILPFAKVVIRRKNIGHFIVGLMKALISLWMQLHEKTNAGHSQFSFSAKPLLGTKLTLVKPENIFLRTPSSLI